MKEQTFQIPKQLDGAVIGCFKKVVEEFGMSELSISVVGGADFVIKNFLMRMRL